MSRCLPLASAESPSAANGYHAAHAGLLADSYADLLGEPLLKAVTAQTLAQALYEAPFALVSHGIEADPMFNYANLTAQRLFELDWPAFVRLPSRESAEPLNREARAVLMAQVCEQGYVRDYSGVRVSATGRRFRIEQARIWNLKDAQGHPLGQAAVFDRWRHLT